jgi:TDG/mug DNA glycosylase family protein
MAPPASADILPDLLVPGLRVVFCGTAAGTASALKGAYYAGPGNRFWRTLHETGLTPTRLAPEEFRSLPGFGIGLTDLAKAVSGADADLPPGSFDVAGFTARIVAVKAGLVAFNGVAAARAFLGVRKGPLPYGIRPAGTVLGMPSFAVLPSTSGAANGSWDIGPWHEVARYSLASV